MPRELKYTAQREEDKISSQVFRIKLDIGVYQKTYRIDPRVNALG